MTRVRRLVETSGSSAPLQALFLGLTSSVLVAGLAFVATRTAKAPEAPVAGGTLARAPTQLPTGEQPSAPETAVPQGPGVQRGAAAAPQSGVQVVRRGPGQGGGGGARARYENPEEGVFADRIHVGGTAPLQGALATYAEQGVAGAESRVRFTNDRGGINGRKARLIYYDTQGQCQQALAGTKRLIEVDKLLVYGGTDQVGCVADYLLQKGVPFIGDLGLHRKSFEYPNIFPIGPGPYHAGHLQAKFVTKYTGAKRIGIIQLGDDFLGDPRELLADAKKAYEFYGAQVVASDFINFDDSDCTDEMRTVREANPDFIVLPATFNQALLCVTVATKTMLYKPPKGWGGTGLGVKFFADNIPRDAEPVYAGTFYDPVDTPSPGMQEYVAIMRRYHPEIDETSFVTLNYYLSAKLNGYLIERCGEAPTRRCLFDTANSLTNWDTGLGITLTYRPGNHTPTLKTHVLTLRDKEWRFLYREDPSSPVWWEDNDIPPGQGIVGH